MPLVGFEPTTPVFERAKTFHALDRTPTVIARIGAAEMEFVEGTENYVRKES
jgi:hypothetical protein